MLNLITKEQAINIYKGKFIRIWEAGYNFLKDSKGRPTMAYNVLGCSHTEKLGFNRPEDI